MVVCATLIGMGYDQPAVVAGTVCATFIISVLVYCLSAMAEHGCLHAGRFVVGFEGNQNDECYRTQHSVTLWSSQFATSLGHQKAGRHGPGSVSQYSCNQWPLRGQAQPKQEAQTSCHAVPDHNQPVPDLPFRKRMMWSSREESWKEVILPQNPGSPSTTCRHSILASNFPPLHWHH